MLTPNEQVDLDALELARTLAVRLPNDLGLQPMVIGWDYGLGVYIRLEGDRLVVFGRSERLDHKLIIFEQLLAEGAIFSYLDLRPTNPYYQP